MKSCPTLFNTYLINMHPILCFHTFHLLPTPLFPFFILAFAYKGKDIVVFRFIIESQVVVAYGILAPE
jgi:hypothetical protein